MCVTIDDPTMGNPVQSEAGLSLSEWWWSYNVGAARRTNGTHCWHAQVSFQKTQVQPQLKKKLFHIHNTAQYCVESTVPVVNTMV